MHDFHRDSDEWIPAPPAQGPDLQAMQARLDTKLFGSPPAPVFIDRFEILRSVGHGAMGEVFVAHDPKLDRPVALKRLITGALASQAERARLIREARVLARLSHPNVVHVYDTGQHEDGVYVAMEYVEGQSLADWQRETDASWQEVLDVYLQAGEGLSAAHEAGITHRDFKPANVLLGKDGRVRVVDFGLARGLAPSTTASVTTAGVTAPLDDSLTHTGVAVGTPAYMAPEQHDGHRGDRRSDVYAYCVSLYEALYRRRPFEGKSTAELAVLKKEGAILPPLVRRGPRGLLRVLKTGLSARAHDRPASMRALLDELRRARSEMRRIALSGAIGVLAVLGMGTGLGGWEKLGAELARFPAPTLDQRPAASEVRTDDPDSLRTGGLRLERAMSVVDDDPTVAAILLRTVEDPAQVKGWVQAARDVLRQPLGFREFRGHEGNVTKIRTLPGTDDIVSCGEDGTVLRWDTVTQRSQVLLRSNENCAVLNIAPKLDRAFVADVRDAGIYSVSLSGEGVIEKVGQGAQLLALDPQDRYVAHTQRTGPPGTVYVRDGRTLGLVRTLTRGDSGATHLEFDRAGDRLIVADWDGLVEVWDVKTWRSTTVRHDPEDIVWRARPSPVEDLLVTVSQGGSVALWRASPDRGYVREADVDLGTRTSSVAFSPDGKTVATASEDRVIRIWQVPDLQPLRSVAYPEHHPTRVKFSPDGSYLAIQDKFGNVQVWYLRRGQLLVKIPRGKVSAFDHRRPVLYTQGSGYAIRATNLERQHQPTKLCCNDGSSPQFAVVSHDRQRVLTRGPGETTVAIWGIDGVLEHYLEEHDGVPWGAAFSRDGSMVAVTTDTGAVWLYQGQGRGSARRVGAHENQARSPTFSPNGEFLVTASLDNTARVWRTSASRTPQVAVLEGHKEDVRLAMFISGNEHVLTASHDGEVRLWGVADAARYTVLARHDKLIETVAIDENRRRLATSSYDETAGVWDLDHGTEIRRLEHPKRVRSVEFGPNGELLTACNDGIVRIWPENGGRIELPRHNGKVRSAKFSPDGLQIASAGYDDTIRLWDWTKQGAPSVALNGHRMMIWDVQYVGNRRVVAFSGDGSTTIWNSETSANDLRERLLNAVPMCLSTTEYEDLLHVTSVVADELHEWCRNEVSAMNTSTLDP